ncbi:hypothetical protein FQA39_LY14065 [Lamprigera yunnana]|nr:hypothetical protein FQA39_LY14065 [Lamprigera yunnana]
MVGTKYQLEVISNKFTVGNEINRDYNNNNQLTISKFNIFSENKKSWNEIHKFNLNNTIIDESGDSTLKEKEKNPHDKSENGHKKITILSDYRITPTNAPNLQFTNDATVDQPLSAQVLAKARFEILATKVRSTFEVKIYIVDRLINETRRDALPRLPEERAMRKPQGHCLMSKRTILSRPRTRLYDSSYNIGESMYRPALDRLNRKYTGRPLSPPPRQNSLPEELLQRHDRAFLNDDLANCRRRAEKHISGETFFDSRGARLDARELLDNFDEETISKIKSIRANKKVSLIDDVDMESTVNNINTRRFLDRTEKILDTVGIVKEPHVRAVIDDEDFSYRPLSNISAARKAIVNEGESVTKHRSIKFSQVDQEEGAGSKDYAKWVALKSHEDDKTENATLRAQQSRSRMDELDEEMEAIAQRQAVREKKAARLRALINEVAEENGILPPVSARRILRVRDQEEDVAF